MLEVNVRQRHSFAAAGTFYGIIAKGGSNAVPPAAEGKDDYAVIPDLLKMLSGICCIRRLINSKTGTVSVISFSSSWRL